MENNPALFYSERLIELNKKLDTLQLRQKKTGWLRFITIAGGAFAAWQVYSISPLITIITIIFTISGFLLLVSSDIANNRLIRITKNLIQINLEEQESLQHHFKNFPEGKQFDVSGHAYSNDLDITGHASLFQYTCRASSEPGQALLAAWLLNPAAKEVILSRQESVRELSHEPVWRQQLREAGLEKTISAGLSYTIGEWIHRPLDFITSTFWKIIRYLLPSLAIGSLALNIAGVMPDKYFYPYILVQTFLAFAITKKTLPAQKGLGSITTELQSLQDSLSILEEKQFNASLLNTISNKLSTGAASSALSVKQLKGIMDRIDYRLNPLVYLPLNILLCWDLQQVFHLEAWRKKHQDGIAGWFDALAEAEALSSLANLAFNHPHWAYPVIADSKGCFKASQLGHPLIPVTRMVCSDFSTEKTGHINLITGSNMAGKSTFLRSTGINIVLAMAGAPVNASSLEVSVMKVMSSMRISDNLEENTSTFYAELKKLRDIIEAVQRKEPVFLLLDEILRGTNSADRQAGSQALIRQLLRDEAAGMVATHDLALTKMANEFPGQISNYHFDVQVNGEELWFDYKLKTGICSSMNASLLMKKIGIQL